jgi:hypothetical protein
VNAALDDIIQYATEGQTQMADHYISLNRGANTLRDSSFAWTTSSTAGAELEVRILDAVGWKKSEIAYMLRAIADRIVNNQSVVDADSKSVDAFL